MGRAAKHLKREPVEAGRTRKYVGALVATGLVVLAGTGGVALARAQAQAKHLLALGDHPQPPAPGPVTTPPTTHPTTSTTTTSTTTTTAPPTTTTVPKHRVAPGPRVVAVKPVNGSVNIPYEEQVTVHLSSQPRPGTPMPALTPAVPGRWSVDGDELTFVPSGNGFKPWAQEKLTIPAQLASKTRVYHFDVAAVPMRRIQQVLAELKYLPLAFRDHELRSDIRAEPTKQSLVSPQPETGATFQWRYPDIPTSLSALWTAGQANVITTGAIMHFEAVEGLTVDGFAGPHVWSALTAAVAGRHLDPAPYDYLMVTESLPEALVVWQNGKYVYSTPANTGVPGATTQIGTFPVYLRFQYTTMKGTDPDGVTYDVPDVPWVAYFNGGDAVHGYPRYSYGWPQSNGCVELPISNAQVVWGMDPLGTLVTVMGQPLPAGS